MPSKCSSFIVFREPVDPIALGIPTYHDVIPKKDARDLRTIRGKLDSDKYDSIEAWEADMELMIRNAITFNGIESEVGQIALRLQTKLKELVVSVRVQAGSISKKRVGAPDVSKPSGTNGVEGPSKKIKLM